MISDKAATVVVAVVTTMWVINLLAGMFGVNNYQPSEAVNGIFMAIVGTTMALKAKNPNPPNGGDHRK